MTKIYKASFGVELLILVDSILVVSCLMFFKIDTSLGMAKLGHEVNLSLMSASFLALCIVNDFFTMGSCLIGIW